MRWLLLTVVMLGCQKPVPVPTPTPSAADALDAIDSRKPVPLLPMMANHQKQNMREHLVAVQEIVSALGSDDFERIEAAALRIGSSPQMGQMCNHMGKGAPGFTEQALGFHSTADGIVAAAKEQDKAKVLAALDATLKTCTACHETWKQRIVTDAEWQQATSTH